MLKIKIRTDCVQKKIKTLKKDKEPKKKTEPQTAAPIRNRFNLAVSPLAKNIFKREKEICEKGTVQGRRNKAKVTDQEIAKVTERTKRVRIKEGIVTLFRTQMIDGDRRKQAIIELEDGLRKVTQDEMDAMAKERNQATTALVTAAAAHSAATIIALEAKARADAVSDRLTTSLDNVHYERIQLQERTEAVKAQSDKTDRLLSSAEVERVKVRRQLIAAEEDRLQLQGLIDAVKAREAELEDLVTAAKLDRAKACRQLKSAETQAIRFKLGAEAVALTRRYMDKERDQVVTSARIETQKQLTAVNDARLKFERLRVTEKEILAEKNEHVDRLRIAAENEMAIIKKEREDVITLRSKVEEEWKASNDAKNAALDELQKSVNIRNAANEASANARQAADQDLREAAIIKEESKKALRELLIVAGGGEGKTSGPGSYGSLGGAALGSKVYQQESKNIDNVSGGTIADGLFEHLIVAGDIAGGEGKTNGSLGEAALKSKVYQQDSENVGNRMEGPIAAGYTMKNDSHEIQGRAEVRARSRRSTKQDPSRKENSVGELRSTGARDGKGGANQHIRARRASEAKISGIAVRKEAKAFGRSTILNSVTNVTTRTLASAE